MTRDLLLPAPVERAARPRIVAIVCWLLAAATTACHAPAPAPAATATAMAFDWPVPAGWRQETIAFPLDFAPSLAFRGREEVRFMPGFFDAKAHAFWSYTFSWWLDDTPAFDARSIANALEQYYRGLALAVGKDRFTFAADRFRAEFASGGAGGAQFVGTVQSYEPFQTGQPLQLNVEVQLRDAGAAGRRAITFLVSPQSFADAVWNELHACVAAMRVR